MHALRYVTALAVIAASSVAIVEGVGVARAGLRELVAFVPTDEPFHWWSVDPPLVSLARDVMPPDWNENDPASKRIDALLAILARRPLSSINWLRLTRARLAAGRDTVSVERAFVMSVLTGPDEGYVMAQRGLVGIMLWEALPSDIRNHVAADLTGAFIPLSEVEKDAYRNALKQKSEAVRAEIRDALVTARLFPAALARIGL
jgi:hypothetical protein